MIEALEGRKPQVYHRLVVKQIQAAIDTYQNQLRVPDSVAPKALRVAAK